MKFIKKFLGIDAYVDEITCLKNEVGKWRGKYFLKTAELEQLEKRLLKDAGIIEKQNKDLKEMKRAIIDKNNQIIDFVLEREELKKQLGCEQK